MRRLGIALAICLSLIGSAFAQGGMGPGPGTVHSVGSSFTGTGDVISGFKAWWSPGIGYNAAYATGSNPAVDVCDSGGTNCITLNVGTNGYVTAPGATACGGGACVKIKKLYDQSGALYCSGGTACDLVQATSANMPTLITNCGGGANRLCAGFTSGHLHLDNSTFTSTAQPYSVAGVVAQTGFAGVTIFGDSSCGTMLRYDFAAASGYSLRVQASGTNFLNARPWAYNSPNSVAGVFQGASTINSFNNNQTVGTVGSGAWGTTVFMGDEGCESGAGWIGSVHEMGFKNSALSSGNITSVQAQQATNWNFNSYVGPGNLEYTNGWFWVGLRAYKSTTVGNRLVNVCNSGDANCADIGSTSTGNFDVAAATGAPLNCGGAGGTCTIKIWYDQSAALKCSAAACDLTQATEASRFTLVFNCINTSLPCARRAGGSVNPAISAASFDATGTQNYLVSVVAKRTGAFTTQAGVCYMGGGGGDLEFEGATNSWIAYSGAVASIAATDSAPHASNVFHNSTSSVSNLDGTETTINVGTNSPNGSGNITIGSAGGTAMTGDFFECGFWKDANTQYNLGAIYNNQHNYWGF